MMHIDIGDKYNNIDMPTLFDVKASIHMSLNLLSIFNNSCHFDSVPINEYNSPKLLEDILNSSIK